MSSDLPQSDKAGVFENDFMRLEWRNGIIIGTYKQGPVTLDMAKKIVINRLNFTGDRKVPLLINDIGLKGIERDAREYLSTDYALQGMSAGALVTSSVFGAYLANFFLKISLNKPKIPVRIFSNEEDAIKWLSNYL